MNTIELTGGVVQEYSVDDVLLQAAKLKDLMNKALQDGQHYGIIPGTKKPSLLKPGAEKINFLFRIGTGEMDVIRTDMEKGHREIMIKTPMVHIPTGKVIAYGVGSCSTMESKYRWRNQYLEKEVGPVTKEYWDWPKDDYKGRLAILEKIYGSGKYKIKKTPEGWKVLRIEGDGERIENPDIADQYNTVLKMAAKRSYVDGTIKASAASDFFTQDMEDTIPRGAIETEYTEATGEQGPHAGNGDDKDIKAEPQTAQKTGAPLGPRIAKLNQFSGLTTKDIDDFHRDLSKAMNAAEQEKVVAGWEKDVASRKGAQNG